MNTANPLGLAHLWRHPRSMIYYFRAADGSKTSLGKDYGSERFLGAYRLLTSGRKLVAAQHLAAQQFAAETPAPIEAQPVGGLHPGPGFVNRLIDEWIDSYSFQNRASATIRARTLHLVKIRADFGHYTKTEIEAVPRHVLRRWREQWLTGGVQHWNTAVAYSATLGTLLNWATDQDYILVSRMRGMPQVERPEGKLRHPRAERVFTIADEKAFLLAATPAMREMYQLALYTGARISDLCAMRHDNIIAGEGGLWLHYEPIKTRRHGTQVWLPVHRLPPLAALIARLLSRPSRYLLPTRTGGKRGTQGLRNTYYQTKARVEMAGHDLGDLRFNDIRGTCVSRLIGPGIGVSIDHARAVVGHVVEGTAGNYARQRSLAEAAYDAWARALGAPLSEERRAS